MRRCCRVGRLLFETFHGFFDLAFAIAVNHRRKGHAQRHTSDPRASSDAGTLAGGAGGEEVEGGGPLPLPLVSRCSLTELLRVPWFLDAEEELEKGEGGVSRSGGGGEEGERGVQNTRPVGTKYKSMIQRHYSKRSSGTRYHTR